MSLFTCPVCGKPLQKDNNVYVCIKKHSYDIASSGYVNLLLANRKHSANPGDDSQMVAARKNFLGKGYYRPLLDALCSIASKYTSNAANILDAGCGEGYYTSNIYRSLIASGIDPNMAGTDISKTMLKSAAKREPGIEFAVASSYYLPIADGTIDLLLNCFSPLVLSEFYRVLRNSAIFVYVVPAARHLWQLKQILYDTPYLNEEKETPYAGFSYEKILNVSDNITLTSSEDIYALFQMTPYFWNTPKSGIQRLKTLEQLTTQIEFNIHIYRKQTR